MTIAWTKVKTWVTAKIWTQSKTNSNQVIWRGRIVWPNSVRKIIWWEWVQQRDLAPIRKSRKSAYSKSIPKYLKGRRQPELRWKRHQNWGTSVDWTKWINFKIGVIVLKICIVELFKKSKGKMSRISNWSGMSSIIFKNW